jgi:tetratricopeptide (TPR) repeat protein
MPNERTVSNNVGGVRIFMCHRSEDKARVRELAGRLSADGFSPWIDEDALGAGVDWAQEIETAIRTANVFLVCLSKSWEAKTGYVQKEIKHALDVITAHPENDVFIIPALLEGCDIPKRLARWHAVKVYEEAGYQKLSDDLRDYALQSDPMAALAALDRRIERQSTDVEAYVARGYSHRIIGDTRRSMKDLDTALKLDPGCARAHQQRAYTYRAEAEAATNSAARAIDKHNAIADFNKAIKLSPREALYYCDRGDCYSELLGEYPEAIDDYNQALQLAPDFMRAFLGRGFARRELGAYREAVKDFDQVLERETDAADAYAGRGLCRQGLDDLPGALADLDRAIVLDPNFAQAYLDRASVKRKQGDRSGAKTDEATARSLDDSL